MSLSRWDWKWWLATVLTIVSVAATIAPAYWSYICRSSGKFCEGSIVAPAADLDSAKRLSGKLADKESRRTFKTLTAREAGFWPFGPRYDVIAEYTDRPSEVIGSVPQNMVDSYHVDPSSGSIFFYGSANSSRNGNVRAFIIDDQLDRRTLTLGSAIGPTSNVQIKNLHFDRKLKEIVFDVEIDNRHLEVNEKTSGISGTLPKTIRRECISGFQILCMWRKPSPMQHLILLMNLKLDTSSVKPTPD